MGELFQIDRTGITRHINKISEYGELEESEVMIKVQNTHFNNPSQKKPQTYITLMLF